MAKSKAKRDFWLKLKTFDVKVKTHFDGGKKRDDPLVDIADLILAAATDPIKTLLCLPVEFGSLTLHETVNGDPLRSSLLLTNVDEGSGTAENPLIITSSKEPVSYMPHDMDSRLPSPGFDGIDMNREHLPRTSLVEKLMAIISQQHRIILLTSLAASGKTSLYSLYKSAETNYKVIGVFCLYSLSCFDLLKETGIDLKARKITRSDVASNPTVIFLDDAQQNFHQEDFWFALVKGLGQWITPNIKFIISCTHSLATGNESPVDNGQALKTGFST